MRIELVADNYMLVTEPCDCRGDPECECWYVDGVRMQITREADLDVLFRNLAIAGALTRAYVDGRCDGIKDGQFLQSRCGDAP